MSLNILPVAARCVTTSLRLLAWRLARRGVGNKGKWNVFSRGSIVQQCCHFLYWLLPGGFRTRDWDALMKETMPHIRLQGQKAERWRRVYNRNPNGTFDYLLLLGMWHRHIWYVVTIVLEELTASIFREKAECHVSHIATDNVSWFEVPSEYQDQIFLTFR
jgi:hypothetical protein